MGFPNPGSGGGGLTEPVASIPLGVVDPDNRLNAVFFDDFEWALGSADISANTLLTDNFLVTLGGGIIEGTSNKVETEGFSCLHFDISTAGVFILDTRFVLAYPSVSKLIIESRFKLSDTTNNQVFLGFVQQPEADAIGNDVGYGMGSSGTNFALKGVSAVTGASQAKDTDFHVWRVELNMVASAPENMELFKDGVSVDTVSGLTNVVMAVIPTFQAEGQAGGDDFYIDYIKVSAEV
jgi:hypothetical protein